MRKSLRSEFVPRRGGAVLVLFALMLIAILGLLGLVIDGGFMMATHRQVQNGADAAALAAAVIKKNGGSDSTALTEANVFLKTHNISTATDLVLGTTLNIPPASGPYAGDSRYVEVLASASFQTLVIHVLGLSQTQTVNARAVAGYESVAAGEGVIVLRRDAAPGLSTTGGGIIRVDGRVIVNSEGGGVDEFGNDVDPADDLSAGAVGLQVQTLQGQTPPGGIYASLVEVVGGAHAQSVPSIYAYTAPGLGPDNSLPSPFHARAIPEPDPLIDLPTPTTSTGVDATDYAGNNSYRGTVSITSNGTSGNINNGYVSGLNSVITATNVSEGNLPGPFLDSDGNDIFTGISPAPFQAGDVVLYPGIYDSIGITGGRTFFTPGIYVIAPQANVVNPFTIGGNVNSEAFVVGHGVMFYNTGNSYNPSTGAPDKNDGETPPPGHVNEFNDGTSYLGGFTFNKDVTFSPLDTAKYSYGSYYTGAPAPSSDFDGLLFYQRRRNDSTFQIGGNAADAALSGTIYAKWAQFTLAGTGSYDAQFIVGSMQVTGGAEVTILAAGEKRGRANQVFLVE